MHRLTRHARIAALAVGALAGCSPPPQPTIDATLDADATFDAPIDTFVRPGVDSLIARFNVPTDGMPPAFEIPFPSDVYRGADGLVVRTLSDFSSARLYRNAAVFASGLAGLDGFGVNAGAMFVIDSTTAAPGGRAFAVDPTTLPATAEACLAAEATAFIVDLDASSTAATARVPCVAGWQPPFRMVTVQPEHAVLRPGHRYAAVLTTAIRAAGSSLALAPSPAFRAIRDSAPGARASTVGQLYGSALDRMVALFGSSFDIARVASIAVFTTQTTALQLRAARDALSAGRVVTLPTLSTDATLARPFSVVRFGASAHTGWTATLDEWLGTPRRHNGLDLPGFPIANEPGAPPNVGIAHDAIGAVLVGTFVAPEYRAADGRIAFAADGAPVPVDAANRLPVTLVLPRGAAPAGGFPVVIYGHGLGNQRREMLAIVNTLARAGIATAAIDHATFGQRASPTDTLSLENGSYQGPDGFGDSPSYAVNTFFGDLTNIIAFRDNIRQTVLDLGQLRRLLGNSALDLSFVADEYGGVAPRLDGTHVGYVGHSLGGIIGTVFAGSAADVNPVVLSVTGGAFLTHLAADAPAEATLLGTVAQLFFGAPSNAALDRFHPVSNLIQTIIDGADPAAFASEITHPLSGRPRDVLLTESLWDETVSNSSTELLAHIMALPQIRPIAIPFASLGAIDAPVHGNLAMGATGAYLQNTPATHGASMDARYGQHQFQPPFPTSDPANRFPRLGAPYFIREWIVPYQNNIAAFFSTSFQGSAQITIAGMTPLVDHDDDGWTDDEERTATTNPFDPSSHPTGVAPHVRDVGF